jgi:hypothetical protein
VKDSDQSRRYASVPDFLNWSHSTCEYDPVILRFEGGNDKGGFCITETRLGRINVHLHGDLAEIYENIFILLGMIKDHLVTDIILGSTRILTGWWVLLEIRYSSRRISIYTNSKYSHATRCPINPDDDIPWSTAINDFVEALEQVSKIMRKFYNV